MLSITVETVCDGCGTRVIGAHQSAADARSAAEGEGWKVFRVFDVVLEFCGRCQRETAGDGKSRAARV